ncbi:MAG: DUF501 domain-containing protein [Bacillota bacterium]
MLGENNIFEGDLSDLNIIRGQLENSAENVIKVSKYCPTNYPMVILVHPFCNDKPFPTIYWLSCPVIKEDIFKLEDTGYIKKLKQKKNLDSEFRDELDKVHKKYSQARVKLLSNNQLEHAKLISEDLYNMLVKSGVAGIRDKEGIKCLHGHYADYLINKNNPVGREVSKKIEIPSNCNFCKRYLGNKEGENEQE